jgi:hypothetical protein
MILAIDFDGTIARTNFPLIEGEMPGAGDTLRRLHDSGHYLIVWTCRSGENLLNAVNWLLAHHIPFDRINDHNPDNVRIHGSEGKKVYAHCYIDDRNLGGFPGWEEAEKIIRQMEVEYKISEQE